MDKKARKRADTHRWLLAWPCAVPRAIFLFVVAVTLLAIFLIEKNAAEREQAVLRETAQANASALERLGSANASYLRAGAAMMATVREIPTDLIPRFVAMLQLDADFRGADGLGWARVMKPDEIAEFEDIMRQLGRSAFTVNPWPRADTRRVVPVTFLRPDTIRNRRAIGYDMASETVRRQAMEVAQQTEQPTASGKVVLVQEGGINAPGFLIFMPVFEGKGREKQLRGYIYSPFNAQNFLESGLELENHGEMGLALYDGDVRPENLLAEVPAAYHTGQKTVRTVEIANRPMQLVVESSQANSLSGLSLATLIFGLSVASLLFILVRIMTEFAQESEALLQWYEEQSSIRDSLTRELNHRVKNSLASVLSIIALTRNRAETIEEFAQGLGGRIRALAATHDLLTQSEWGATPIRSVVEAELAPYSQSRREVTHISGPHVELAPNDALSLGLAVHELATNAAKYGALSQIGGCVWVDWEMLGTGHVRLRWREEGGPTVGISRKRGFGTELLQRIVARQLGSRVELDFAPEGVQCTMTIPVREPRAFSIRAHRSPTD